MHLAQLQAKRLSCSPCSVLLKDKELARQSTYNGEKLFCSCSVTMQIIFDFSVNKISH